MRYSSLSIFLFCVFLFCGLASQSFAQRTLGVRWNVPDDQAEALAQLDTLEKLGVSYLEITERPANEIWQKIDTLGFRVYGHIPISFPLVNTFSEPDSSMLAGISSYINHYSARASVEAIGLFKYGAVQKAAFDAGIQPIVSQIKENYSGNLYYTTVRNETTDLDEVVDFKMLETRISNEFTFPVSDTSAQNPGGYIYQPGPELKNYLKPFSRFLDSVTKAPAPVFVDSEWLFAMLNKYPDFANTVELYNSDAEFIFPTPKESIKNTFNHSFIVLLLVLIWGLFAANHHLSPVYRKSLTRYFTGHVFFVEDVMDRHIRSMGPAIIVLLQNILLAGICTYSLGKVLFSPLALEAIYYHYPIILLFNNPSFSLFLLGCISGFVLTLISILWIRISNKEVKQTRQVLNLYAWPLQINFFIATVIVAILSTGNNPVLIVLLTIVFSIVHISAFIITAADTSKYLKKQKALFITVSIVLYCVLWVGLGVWVVRSSIPQVVQLALSLS